MSVGPKFLWKSLTYKNWSYKQPIWTKKIPVAPVFGPLGPETVKSRIGIKKLNLLRFAAYSDGKAAGRHRARAHVHGHGHGHGHVYSHWHGVGTGMFIRMGMGTGMSTGMGMENPLGQVG